ncbi:hypothetical protein Tco_1306620 [Tanacetum coccineum]
MSSITAQQTKLDLELVPKEKRLNIGKCKGRLNLGKIQREPTFQVVLDALALTPCHSAFLVTVDGQDFDALPTDEEIVSFLRDLGHTREINSLNDVTTGLDKLRLSRAQILWGMYHQKNVDYVELLWEHFIYQIDNKAYKKQEKIPEIKETKAYKTYLGFTTGATPPKKAQKFKKPASPQLTIVPVSPEEPTGKSKRVKRPTKKSTKAPARGVVIKETPEMPLSKKKEMVDVSRGKGIELLSDVALTEEAQYEEVRRKSMRTFHKTHPSGSGTVTKTDPSVAKIKPSFTNEGTSGNDEDDNNNEQDLSGEDNDQENDSDDDKTQSDNENDLDSEHETNENESGSESDQDENEKEIGDEEEEVNDKFVKTPSNDSDDEDETKITDKVEGDEDEDMDYTTSQLYDDVDIWLNEPVDTDKGFIQEEGTNAEITNVQQGNESSEISQVIEDAHVTLSTVPHKTEVPVTSSSHSSDLASKLLNFSDIPHTNAEIISPMDVHVHHEVPSQQTPKLLTVPISVIVDSSPVFFTVIPQSLPSFTPQPQQ